MRATRSASFPYALIPALLMSVGAMAATSRVDDALARTILQLVTISAATIMAWRAGAVARAHKAGTAAAHPPQMTLLGGDSRLPTIDRLSGLYANWYFRLRVDEEIVRANRYGLAFAIVKITADSVASLDAARFAVHRVIRKIDLAANLADGLAILLPHTRATGARVVADRLCAQVPGLQFSISAYPASGKTVSALLGEEEWQASALGTFVA